MDRQCRVCLSFEGDDFTSVFGTKGRKIISDMLTTTTGVAIDEFDRLPQYLCQQCLNHLIQIYCTRKRYSFLHLSPKCQKGQENDYHRCRVCAKTEVEELLSLRCVYAEEKLKIEDVIRLTTGVTIRTGDCLPAYICNICLDELSLWYEFKKQVLQSEKELLRQVLFAWEKMEYESTRPGHLVVDLYAEVIFSGKDGVTLHCSVCKLTVPWEQLGEECEGCLLQFRNFKKIRQDVLESGLLSSRNCDSEDSMCVEMTNEETVELFVIEPESPTTMPISYNPIDSKVFRLFEVVEACSDGPYYMVRRKGPTCCGCDIFFLTKEELSEHLQLEHSKDSSKAKFKCDKCNSGFSRHWCLVAHTDKLKQDTYYYCSECNVVILNMRMLTNHKASAHLAQQNRKDAMGKFISKSRTVYTCCVKLCEERCSSEKQLLEHCNEIHSPTTDPNELTCQYCQMRFQDDFSLAHHRDRVFQTFFCQIDDCSFNTKRESLITLHCSQNPHIKANRAKLSLDKTFVPDLKRFVVVGSADENTDILETKSVICCGCSDFFENQEELEKHCDEQHAAVEDDYPIRCTRCNKGFRKKTHFTRHEKNAINRNFYYCRPCKMFLWFHCSFKRHKKETHLDAEKEAANDQFTMYASDSYTCCGCFQQFSEMEDLVEHRRVSHPANDEERGFKCDHCNRRFYYFSTLKRHQKLFSGKQVYKCKLADCIYETKDLSKMKLHVMNPLHKTTVNGSIQSVYNPYPSMYRCCCVSCMFKCVSYDEMIEHGLEHHVELRERYAVQYGDKAIKCRVCLKGFDQEFQLLNHRNGKPKLRCKYCEKLFLIRDFNAHHDKCKLLPKVTCEQCPKQFLNSLLVEKHVKKCHNRGHKSSKSKRLRIELCNVCGAMMDKHELIEHMQSHQNIRPYKCKLCPKSFFRKLIYQRHALVHTGEKPYPCRQGCENRYKAPGDRDRHEKLVHLGITPFSCQLCPKAFVRERDLRLHQRIHTGMKLFHCKFCNEGFDVMKLFDEHMKSCVQAPQ